ncbi:MAG TPA: hypothetical protein VK681_39010 [Reyranella sp.]|nr:hypothetical protein [Reyranella sp.]
MEAEPMDCMVVILTRDIPGLGVKGDRLGVRPGHPTAPAVVLHGVYPNYGLFAGLLADGALEPVTPSDASEISRKLEELVEPSPVGPRPRRHRHLRLSA